MPATNSISRCLPPYVFFASTPLSSVLEELIIPQNLIYSPKLYGTKGFKIVLTRNTHPSTFNFFLELELNAGGSCRRLGFKLNLHKEGLIMPLPKSDIQ
jgi:hypothetical protein